MWLQYFTNRSKTAALRPFSSVPPCEVLPPQASHPRKSRPHWKLPIGFGNTSTLATFPGLNAPKRKTVLARGRVLPLPDGRLLAVALDIADQERLLVRLGATIGGAFLLALLLGGLSADWLARRFVRSLGSISAAAGRIRAFPHRGKHVSIVWKTARNLLPLCGKISETRFHCVEKPRKHVSIAWNFLRGNEKRRLSDREGAAPSAPPQEERKKRRNQAVGRGVPAEPFFALPCPVGSPGRLAPPRNPPGNRLIRLLRRGRSRALPCPAESVTRRAGRGGRGCALAGRGRRQ